MKALIAMCCLVLPLVAVGQDRIPVQVLHEGNDPVGFAVSMEMRKAILGIGWNVPYYSARDFRQARIMLTMTSVDVDAGSARSGVRSAIAIAILYNPSNNPIPPALTMHLHTRIQLCGAAKVVDCAREILEAMNQEVETLRKLSPEVWKELSQVPPK